MKYPGAARNKVTEEWRKLHSDELHDQYCSPDIIRVFKSRRIRWAGHVARMEGSGAYSVLVTKHEGSNSLGRPWHRWVDNITLDLKKVCWKGADWTDLAQGRNN
jgi:hypothetical protein